MKKTPIANESAWGQVKIQKISADQGDNGKKLTATFKVQQKQDDGTYGDYPEGNAMTITTDPAKDYVISGFLPEGEYQLVETSVQSDIRWTRRPSSLSSFSTGLPAGTIRLTAYITPWMTRMPRPTPL